MPQVKCKNCGREFYSKPNWIKNGFGKYCSRKCGYESRKTGKMVSCFICSKRVYKSGKAINGSKSKKYFCGKSCQAIWRNSIVNIGPNHPNWKGGKHVSYRNILIKNNVPAVCFCCKNKDKRVLTVHHIDENHSNNKLLNLIWLCYNCHFLAHNHIKEKQILIEKLKNK